MEGLNQVGIFAGEGIERMGKSEGDRRSKKVRLSEGNKRSGEIEKNRIYLFSFFRNRAQYDIDNFFNSSARREEIYYNMRSYQGGYMGRRVCPRDVLM